MAHTTPLLRSLRPRSAGQRAATPHPHRRTVVGAAFAALASVAALLSGVTPAAAQPSVTEVEAQIDQAWNKLEPVIEQYNATHEDLIKKQAEKERLAKQISPLELSVDMAMDRVGEFAAQSYMGNDASAVNAILSTGSPSQLTDQIGLLAHFARQQRDGIQAAMDAKDKLAKQKAPLDALVAELQKTDKELSVKKTQINAEVDRLQKLRDQVGSKGDGNYRLANCPVDYNGSKGSKVAQVACDQIGKDYVWGADGPGTFDCSGLMLFAWAKYGVHLPHNAAQQYHTMRHVSRSELQAGDLVFYNGLAHVGMYVGGDYVVHAPHTGDVVRMKKIDVGSIVGYGRP